MKIIKQKKIAQNYKQFLIEDNGVLFEVKGYVTLRFLEKKGKEDFDNLSPRSRNKMIKIISKELL